MPLTTPTAAASSRCSAKKPDHADSSRVTVQLVMAPAEHATQKAGIADDRATPSVPKGKPPVEPEIPGDRQPDGERSRDRQRRHPKQEVERHQIHDHPAAADQGKQERPSQAPRRDLIAPFQIAELLHRLVHVSLPAAGTVGPTMDGTRMKGAMS